MAEGVKRRYDNTRRQQQARDNRRRIIAAATELFAGHGYAGTTFADVAERAGVAVQTVYAAFGNKVTLLKQAIDVALAGDDEPVPLAQRQPARNVAAEADPYRIVQMYAAQVKAILSRAAGVLFAAWAAAPGDPEVAALVDDLDAQRLQGMTAAAAGLATKARQSGTLAAGVTEEEIRDTLWALNSAPVYRLLLHDRGWTPEHLEQWLVRTWTSLFLRPQPAAPPKQP